MKAKEKRRCIFAVAGAAAVLASGARAYTVSSLITSGCHEEITSQALRTVRAELTSAPPIQPTENEKALIADLQFTPDADMTDLGAASLLIGVRDNDLKGRSSTDLTELALVQGDPNAQQEHCLRDSNQPEPDGSMLAVEGCRAFIHQRINQALAALDATGKPDPNNRIALPLHLEIRGDVVPSLPTFYVRMGQAMHAIEDSFTHTYRTSDGSQITVVLDWIDEANGTTDEAVHGPPHSTEMDRCDDPDPLRTQRHRLALALATSVLRATLDPSLTGDEKLAQVEIQLDQNMTYSPGCTLANRWCNAPEYALGNTPLLNCSSTRGSNAWLGWSLAMLFSAWFLRSSRCKPCPRGSRRSHDSSQSILLFILLGSLTLAGAARADEPPPPLTQMVDEPGPRDRAALTLGGFLGASGSINNGALALALGARLRVSNTWTFGVDFEWNPWLAYSNAFVRSGAINIYGSVIHRLPLAYEQFNLRTTGSLGTSILLLNLYGAPSGSTGIFLDFSPLGLEWKVSRLFYLIINPLNYALPVPQLRAVPFGYPQYRATVGLEIYTG